MRILSLFLCGIAIAMTSYCEGAEPETRPHIVIAVADDLGWKDVGFHGSEIATPTLDRLASDGVRLGQHYVQPVCSPTRASLMTGRYPIRMGLQKGVIRPWADYGLPLEERTLAEALSEAGYRTSIAGKWHLGSCGPEYLPMQRGFDRAYGHYLGMIDYFTHERQGGLDWHRDGKPLREEGYTTELIAREAARIVKEHHKESPLFLYVPFNAPHTPLQAPQKHLDRYMHIADEKRRKYAAMVSCMDDAIGTVVESLKAQKMWENTLFLFFSDNGGPTRHGADNGPLRGAKGSLYEGGVRVPAFVVWPSCLRGGSEVNEIVHVTDWYPTLLNIARASLSGSKPLDGKDIWKTISEGAPSPHTEILHNVNSREGALRRGDWKLVEHFEREDIAEKTELFNIAEDPNEKVDLSEKYPEKTTDLRMRLDAYTREAADERDGHQPRPVDFVIPAVWGNENEK